MRRLSVLAALWRLGFAEALAYRASLAIWILATTFPLVALALWAGIARAGGPVGGYGEAEFVAYFVTAFVVRQLTASWVVWDLERQIRLGELSVLLLRPVSPILHHMMQNLAALPVRLLLALPLAIVVLIAAGGLEITGDAQLLMLALPALLGAWILNFAIQTVIASLAFWWQRSATLFEIWTCFFVVLSGYALPTSLLPGGLAGAVRVLPFHALLGFPVELLLGQLGVREALYFLTLQWLWVALSVGLAILTWRRGLRAYSAFGA